MHIKRRLANIIKKKQNKLRFLVESSYVPLHQRQFGARVCVEV
jgi:hypothetical protein